MALADDFHVDLRTPDQTSAFLHGSTEQDMRERLDEASPAQATDCWSGVGPASGADVTQPMCEPIEAIGGLEVTYLPSEMLDRLFATAKAAPKS